MRRIYLEAISRQRVAGCGPERGRNRAVGWDQRGALARKRSSQGLEHLFHAARLTIGLNSSRLDVTETGHTLDYCCCCCRS